MFWPILSFQMHEDAKRLEVIEKSLQKDPNNVCLLIEKAYLLIDVMEPEEALRGLDHAATLEPHNVDVLFWKAKVINHTLFDREQAKAILEQALKINPNRADCLFFLAGLEPIYEDHAAATVILKKVILSEPSWPNPRLVLCSHLIEIGHLDDAEQELAAICEIANKISQGEIVVPSHTNPLEEYYEEVVTGRTSNIEKRCNRLVKEITEAQTRSS